MLDLSMLSLLWPPHTRQAGLPSQQLLAGIAAAAPTVMPKYGLTSDLLVAHAMSQFSHECGNGCTLTESIRYSPQRASEVWPSRFSGGADCEAKVGCAGSDTRFPKKLIDLVYGGRNGNRPGTSDGSTFIGRGLLQVTGRANYQQLGDRVGLDLIADPDLVNHPQHALECGVAMFVLRGALQPASEDNARRVTKLINGGQVGIEDRLAKLALWKRALLQQALNRLGAEPDLLTDGVFGKKSIEVMMAYQRRRGLPVNGRSDDAATLARIEQDFAVAV